MSARTLGRAAASAALAALFAAAVTAGPAAAAGAPKVPAEKKAVLEWLSKPETVKTFGEISDKIWAYAELGLQETRSSKLLADTLEQAGFTVERGLAGMPTCFVATFGSGAPVIGLLGEFDALPMLSQKARTVTHDPVVEGAPGHGCGHNEMCTAAAAAAIALKQAMEKYRLPGTIKVFGSPAEEIIASRPYMIRAGLFKGVDVVLDNHSSDEFSTGYGTDGNAVYSAVFSFRGRTSHAAGAPWAGRSALDAVELMDIATNFLREHLPLSHRLHYVILEGGEAPNVVPDRASVWYYVRNDDAGLEDMYRRVVDCAKGAALATGTELLPIRVISAVHQRHANKALAGLVQANIELVGMPQWPDEDQAFAKALQKSVGAKEDGMPSAVGKLEAQREGPFIGGGSSDVGDVTLIAPTVSIQFPGQVPGTHGHHWSVVACNAGSTAWLGLNAGAKAIAASAVDLLTKPKALAAIRAEFDEYAKTHPYKTFLPDDAQPPLDINKALMERFRPLLERVEGR